MPQLPKVLTSQLAPATLQVAVGEPVRLGSVLATGISSTKPGPGVGTALGDGVGTALGDGVGTALGDGVGTPLDIGVGVPIGVGDGDAPSAASTVIITLASRTSCGPRLDPERISTS
jgi:hypothetical protein